MAGRVNQVCHRRFKSIRRLSRGTKEVHRMPPMFVSPGCQQRLKEFGVLRGTRKGAQASGSTSGVEYRIGCNICPNAVRRGGAAVPQCSPYGERWRNTNWELLDQHGSIGGYQHCPWKNAKPPVRDG